MNWIDVSVPIRVGMPVYEGDPSVSLQRVVSMAEGDLLNLSRLGFGVHTGTHIDGPIHFLDGAPGVESIPLDALVGPALVVDGSAFRADLNDRDIESLAIPAGTERVLFRTANSRLWDLDHFSDDFIALKEDAARALLAQGVRLVGIDYLSIAPRHDPAPTHRAFLSAGCVILEGLDLRNVVPGRYELLALPLLIPGSDGGPARALLRPVS